MTSPKDLIISSDSPERIMGAMNALMPQLGPEEREKLDWIKLRYWQLYGFDGLYERVNNRTVAQILAEYDSTYDSKPIESGEVDGVRYELYGGANESDNIGTNE